MYKLYEEKRYDDVITVFKRILELSDSNKLYYSIDAIRIVAETLLEKVYKLNLNESIHFHFLFNSKKNNEDALNQMIELKNELLKREYTVSSRAISCFFLLAIQQVCLNFV